MIDKNDKKLSIRKQCSLIDLPRADYYYQPKAWSPEALALMRIIDELYTEHPYYGARRMSKALAALGHPIGRKGVRAYYAVLGLHAIYPRMNLSKRNQAHKVYPYLLQGVTVDRVNQVWSTDITYIRLSQGFVYLAAVIDWHSRCILSWRVSTTLESDFCVEALKEALERYGPPEIFNTDQGVQFTSREFTGVLESQGIAISMDGKGRALDNVFIERFWRSLKQEKIYRMELETVKDAKTAIAQYMLFYNKQRMHQSLDYKTPESVYLEGLQAYGYVNNSGEFFTYPQAQQLDLFFLNNQAENSISC
jgi:putative transposase